MENIELADIIFKVIIGFSIPYAVKSLAEIRKSIEKLNTQMAVLIEKDINKDRDIESQNMRLDHHSKSLNELEKKIIALQIAMRGHRND